MSNLQDVPLAEPETMPTTEQDTAGSKSNSLKRFFKLGKKPSTFQDFTEDPSGLEDDGRDAGKRHSIGRFFTKLKGSTKSANVQFSEDIEPSLPSQTAQSSVVDLDVEQAGVNKPVPSPKPTLRTSISGYWKQLFHRQKVVNRQDQDPATDQLTIDLQQTLQEKESELTVSQEVPTTAPAAAGAAAAVAVATDAVSAAEKDLESAVPEKTMDNQSNCIPDIIEEVQMLAFSDERADSSNAEKKD